MGNAGSSSLAGTAIKVAAAAGGAALALGAWSYASSLLSQYDAAKGNSDGRKPKTSTESAEDFSSQQLEMFLSDDYDYRVHYQSASSLDVYQIPPDPKPGKIKIMSYNIWCITGVEINERKKAIDKLIQKHSPDIILLQEVTHWIYNFFQKCNWWGSYRCSVPQEKANRGVFCMMLSKLHVTKFYCKHLENTTTGRGLCVAHVETGGKKKMVVATCHLKRPNPPNMHREERVSQANDAVGFLRDAPNAVLGGDMNWDEGSDGPFPLLGKWSDAWSALRPGEDGWTYDTESNGMLAHRRRSLRRRLDRFVCKLKDFELIGIEMIGTEAIPGVKYKSKGTKLPVFPSDHYGLILTICPKQ